MIGSNFQDTQESVLDTSPGRIYRITAWRVWT